MQILPVLIHHRPVLYYIMQISEGNVARKNQSQTNRKMINIMNGEEEITRQPKNLEMREKLEKIK